MGKCLRVICESPTEQATFYQHLNGSEDQFELKELAEDLFFDWANFGFDVIDESQVPDDAEVLD